MLGKARDMIAAGGFLERWQPEEEGLSAGGGLHPMQAARWAGLTVKRARPGGGPCGPNPTATTASCASWSRAGSVTRGSCSSRSRSTTSAAARLLGPAYEHGHGDDGFISFEWAPDLADNTGAAIDQATSLWQRLAQQDVITKVPGMAAELSAIEELTRKRNNLSPRRVGVIPW